MNASAIETSPVVAGSGALLPAATRLGPVELTVGDLERAIGFYTEALGLRVHTRVEERAALGTGGEDLLVLVENRAARRAGRHAGLYHVALLCPSREELARAAVRLVVTRTPIQGASDHGTHEAIYLADPDGNGLELAADRPREGWPDIGDPSLFAGGPQPLDLDGLLGLVAEQPPAPRAPDGLRIGHVHLHVGDTAAALRFYTDLIGFEKVVELGQSAAFVAAGGYHHHLAFNTWRGSGVPPAPTDAVGLRHWTVYVPSDADVAAVRARLARADAAYETREQRPPARDSGPPVRTSGPPAREPGLLVRDPAGNVVLIETDPLGTIAADPRPATAITADPRPDG